MAKDREEKVMGSKDHWEKTEAELGMTSDLKYTNQPNPEALRKSTDKLAEYAKKNRMEY
jgi:hypothetical protein